VPGWENCAFPYIWTYVLITVMWTCLCFVIPIAREQRRKIVFRWHDHWTLFWASKLKWKPIHKWS